MTEPPPLHLDVEDLTLTVGRSPEQAAQRMEAAAKLGFVDAQMAWAQHLLDGFGVEANPAEALRWYREAAERGRPEALNMVGRFHELGWGVPADGAEAARWYARAARRGYAWARFNLAGLLLDGQGVERDVRRALALYVRAARQGHAKAMTMIGRYCENGWDRPAKPEAARRWYRRGADGGDFRGHFNLGRLALAEGALEEARPRLARAIEGGTPEFCRDIAADLLRHPDGVIAALGRRCLARACETGREADIARYRAMIEGAAITLAAGAAPALPVTPPATAEAARNGPSPLRRLREAFARRRAGAGPQRSARP